MRNPQYWYTLGALLGAMVLCYGAIFAIAITGERQR